MSTSAATIERTPLLDSLSQLRLIGERFEEFVSRQCDELEALRAGLGRREGELAQQQSQLDELHHLNELRAVQFEEQSARLDQLTAELAQVRRELNAARQELATPRDNEADALRRHVEELERQRKALQAELAEASERAAAQAAATAEVDELRAELTRARDERQAGSRLRAELDEALAELAQASELAAAQAAALAEVDQLRAELTRARDERQLHSHLRTELDEALAELAQARAELTQPPSTTTVAGEAFGGVDVALRLQAVERERDELAAELESILGRSAALAESAARERRKAAEERSEWESELKSLRRALAAQLQAHTDAAHGQRPPTRNGSSRNGRRATDKSGSQEAVIDSVIAQFAALKKTTGRAESAETVAVARG